MASTRRVVTEEPTPEDEVPTSPEAEELVAAGATPIDADVQAMIDQMRAAMQAQQEQINNLLKERGVPSDPIAAGVTNLVAHVRARAAQSPQFDFSELLDALESLPDEVTPDDAALVKELVADVVDRGRHLELDYLPVLARDLHKETLLKAKSNKEPVKAGKK
jgi:hypothetical protein